MLNRKKLLVIGLVCLSVFFVVTIVPSEVIEKRGIKVVSDDGALMAAIEKAISAQPDVAEKVRGGNLPAAGALIGAVMKETKGQADAAKVRELLLKHLGQ